MDWTERITFVLCMMLVVVGCSEKKADKKQLVEDAVATPSEIVRLMDRMTNEFFTSETHGGNLDCTRIAGPLNSVSNEAVKLQLLDQLMGRILSLDISGLDYRTQCNSLSDVERVVNDVVLGGIYCLRISSLEDYQEHYYDYQLRYFDWLRKQIRRTAPTRHGVAQMANLDKGGQEDRFWWRRMHYGGISTYESQLASLESFYHRNAQRVSKESAGRIKEKIEKFLGRPIRTEEQVKQDLKASRNVEFTERDDPTAAP